MATIDPADEITQLTHAIRASAHRAIGSPMGGTVGAHELEAIDRAADRIVILTNKIAEES